jgi:hypothetical protein
VVHLRRAKSSSVQWPTQPSGSLSLKNEGHSNAYEVDPRPSETQSLPCPFQVGKYPLLQHGEKNSRWTVLKKTFLSYLETQKILSSILDILKTTNESKQKGYQYLNNGYMIIKLRKILFNHM